jgi:hypothetical protein
LYEIITHRSSKRILYLGKTFSLYEEIGIPILSLHPGFWILIKSEVADENFVDAV